MLLETEFVDLTKAFNKEECLPIADIHLCGDDIAEFDLPIFFEKFRWSQFESISYKFHKWDGHNLLIPAEELQVLMSNGYFPFARCNNANFFDPVCLSIGHMSGPVYRFDHERTSFADLVPKKIEFESFQKLLEIETCEYKKYLTDIT